MESNYCGFIRVWRGPVTGTLFTEGVRKISLLSGGIRGSYTVAIFKIKLKQKTNE